MHTVQSSVKLQLCSDQSMAKWQLAEHCSGARAVIHAVIRAVMRTTYAVIHSV